MVKKQYVCGEYRPEPKYHDAKRKSPPYSATDCVGHVLPGNDGNDWIAELSGKSVRWVKLDGKVKSVAKRSGAKRSGAKRSVSGRKSSRKKASGRKSSGRKSSRKKASGRKSSRKKASGRKSSGRKSSGRKSSGRKSSRKKASGRKSSRKAPARKQSLVRKRSGRSASRKSSGRKSRVRKNRKSHRSKSTHHKYKMDSELDDIVPESIWDVIFTRYNLSKFTSLIQSGRFNVNDVSIGETPLTYMLNHRLNDTNKIALLQAGANPNLPNKDGETPHMWLFFLIVILMI